MQVKFDSDHEEGTPSGRTKKRYRITVTASFVIDDDEYCDAEWAKVEPEDSDYFDEDGEELTEKMEADGVEYFSEEDCYAKPRDLATHPITAEEVMGALTDEHCDSFEFLSNEPELCEKLQTFIVEVDGEGKAIGAPQTRNQSEAQ